MLQVVLEETNSLLTVAGQEISSFLKAGYMFIYCHMSTIFICILYITAYIYQLRLREAIHTHIIAYLKKCISSYKLYEQFLCFTIGIAQVKACCFSIASLVLSYKNQNQTNFLLSCWFFTGCRFQR